MIKQYANRKLPTNRLSIKIECGSKIEEVKRHFIKESNLSLFLILTYVHIFLLGLL